MCCNFNPSKWFKVPRLCLFSELWETHGSYGWYLVLLTLSSSRIVPLTSLEIVFICSTVSKSVRNRYECGKLWKPNWVFSMSLEDTGIHGPPFDGFLKGAEGSMDGRISPILKRRCKDQRRSKRSKIFKGNAGIQGPLFWSECLEGIQRPMNDWTRESRY